tara:strand:+ start:327 stop:875 length:549 start_codon:yes stop_codon:yes gene_type:complete
MSPINVIGLDHVVLRVANIKISLEWYKNVLGCVEERIVPNLGLYQLRLGLALIDLVPFDGTLGKIGGGPPTKKRRNMDHFAIQIIDFDEKKIRLHLSRQGVESTSVERRYGSLGHGPSMYILDPDGNTVELKGPPDSCQKEKLDGVIYKFPKKGETARSFARSTLLASVRRRESRNKRKKIT